MLDWKAATDWKGLAELVVDANVKSLETMAERLVRIDHCLLIEATTPFMGMSKTVVVTLEVTNSPRVAPPLSSRML